MTLENKDKINKIIRKYDGDNTFVLSLQKQLKTNKYLQKESFGKKDIKVLSDKQYESAISILDINLENE